MNSSPRLTFLLGVCISAGLLAPTPADACPSTAGCPQPAVNGLEPDNIEMSAPQ